MSTTQYQLGSHQFPGSTIPVHNYGVTDIAAGLGLLADSSNPGTVNSPPGVVLPTASGGVAGSLGFSTTVIPAGKNGLMQVYGVAVCTAAGTVTYGQTVMISDTTSKLGWVKTQTTAGEQIGVAWGTATDGLPVQVLISRAKNA